MIRRYWLPQMSGNDASCEFVTGILGHIGEIRILSNWEIIGRNGVESLPYEIHGRRMAIGNSREGVKFHL